MRFEYPQILFGLWLVVVLVIFFIWRSREHKKLLEKFAEQKLLKDIAQNFDERKRTYKNILIIIVFTFGIIALARPQWGFVWQEVKRQGLDILVVVDCSKSMLTQDVKPNRLERTKLAVKDLVKKLKGDRIGLIAFAGDAFLVCPLTVDYGGFLLSLDDLSVNTVPRGGTNLGRAIEEAMKGYDNTPTKFKSVIITTDGDNLEGDPLAAAKKAKDKGIKIYTIGIGTKEGELIQVPDDQGNPQFFKDDQGNFVKSRLNENLLQKIALTADGTYVRASGAEFGLDYIYENELSKLEKREIESKIEKKFYDRFQFPLAVATLLLVLETCLTTRREKY